MKAIILGLSALFTISLAAKADTWTLDQCIDYAVTHNLTIKQREISQLSAEQSVDDAKSRYLPNVSAGASQSWNLGRGLTSSNTYANRNTSSFSWNGSFSLPLFSGLSTTRQVEYARANLQQIIEQCEAAKEDITLNVIAAYLQILYNQELLQVAKQQVELSEYELTRQQALLDAGKIPEIDMLEAKSQLAQDQLNEATTANNLTLAKIDLIQLLELPISTFADTSSPTTDAAVGADTSSSTTDAAVGADTSSSTTDAAVGADTSSHCARRFSAEGQAISDFDVAPLGEDSDLLITADEAYRLALQHNHSILAAKKGIVSSEKSLKVAQSGYLPTLSFNAGVGSSYYKVSGYANEGFGQQMKHNYSTYFGLSLNIPIFDAFSTRNSVRRAKVEKLNAQLTLDQTEQQLFKSIQQAYYQALGAQEKLAASKVAEDASQQAFAAMQEKYNIGRATPTEYEQAKTKALRCTAERIQANYELILRTRILRFYATPM